MPYKDPEKQREEWHKYYLKKCKKKDPNYKPRITGRYYYFEAHHQLAMSSGIESAWEWRECFKLGLMPDGMYSNPDNAFRRP